MTGRQVEQLLNALVEAASEHSEMRVLQQENLHRPHSDENIAREDAAKWHLAVQTSAARLDAMRRAVRIVLVPDDVPF